MSAPISTVAAPAARASAASSRGNGRGADFAAALDGALTQTSRRPEERPDRLRLPGQDRADERRPAGRTDRTDDAAPVRDRSERPNWVDDRSARGDDRSAWAHTRAAAVRRDRAHDVQSGDEPTDVPPAGGQPAAGAADDATDEQPGAPLGTLTPMASGAWAIVLAGAASPAAPLPGPGSSPAPSAPGPQIAGLPPAPGATAPTHESLPSAPSTPGALQPTFTGTPAGLALAALARAAGAAPPAGQSVALNPTTEAPVLPAVVVESGPAPTAAPDTALASPAVPPPVGATRAAPGVTAPGDSVPSTPTPVGSAAPAASAAPVAVAAAATPAALAAEPTASAAAAAAAQSGAVAPAGAAAPADAAPAVPGTPAAARPDTPVDAAGATTTGRTTSASAPEPADVTGSPSVGVAPTGGTSAAVSVADVDPATPPRDPGVASQLARQLAVLRHAPDGTQTMTLHVTPDELGPVSIQVTVDAGSLELTLRGAHEHGRAALIDSVPDLRRELETAGLSCTRLDVDRDPDAWSGPRQDGRSDQFDGDPRGSARPDHRAGGEHGSSQQSGRDDARRARPLAAAQPGATPLTTAGTAAPSGVDVRV